MALATPVYTPELLFLKLLNERNVKGEAKVRVGPVVLTCRIIQQPGKPVWISLPDVPYRTADGKTKWRRIAEVDEDVWFAARLLILNEYFDQIGFRQDFGLGDEK